MPKLKTRKAAAKRFKVTGSGKVIRRKQGSKHLLSHERSKTKRNRFVDALIKDADIKKVKNMLPYAF